MGRAHTNPNDGMLEWEDPVSLKDCDIHCDGSVFVISRDGAVVAWMRLSDAGVAAEWLLKNGSDWRDGEWTIENGLPVFKRSNE
jgi:hypothetical protein